MFYLLWVSAAILYYILAAWLSYKTNSDRSWTSVFYLWALGVFGVWPIVAKYSRNLIVDGLIFDVIIFFTYFLTLAMLGAAKDFSPLQWGGTLLVVIGIVMLKVG